MAISNAWGMVTARHSGKILDVVGASTESGAFLHQWQVRRDALNQRFRFERLDDGFYRISAKHSGKVLDVAGFSKDNGARIQQWDWHGGDNQRWRHGVPID